MYNQIKKDRKMKKLVVCLVVGFVTVNAYSAVYPGYVTDSFNNQIVQTVSSDAGIYNVQKEYSDSEVVPENVSTEETEVQNENEDFIDSSANAMGIGIF
jgi:hypothetical protein